jgi:hypothetical protein
MPTGKPKALVSRKRAGPAQPKTKHRRTRASRRTGSWVTILPVPLQKVGWATITYMFCKLIDLVFKLFESSKPSIAIRLPLLRRVQLSTSGRALTVCVVGASGFVVPGAAS